MYTAACVDTIRRKYLLVAQNEIAQVNADTFLIEDHYFIPGTPVEMVFDEKLNATFGIVMSTDRQFVAHVDWFQGKVTPLVYFDGYGGITLGTSAYDPVRHLYYAGTSDESQVDMYLRIDIVKKTLTPIKTGNHLDNAEFDTKRDRLIGCLNGTLHSLEGASSPSPKLRPLMDMPGLPLLYASAIDTVGDKYYVGMLYPWFETKTFLSIDLNSNSIIFNTTIFMSPMHTAFLRGQV